LGGRLILLILLGVATSQHDKKSNQQVWEGQDWLFHVKDLKFPFRFYTAKHGKVDVPTG
jgi:hypothetical protein